MKKPIYLIIVLFVLIASIPLQAQQVIKYDFLTKSFAEGTPKKIDHKDDFTVTVTNINTILYDVDVKVNAQSYHTEPPALFLQYFPTISNIPSVLDAIQKATGGGGGENEEQKGLKGVVEETAEELKDIPSSKLEKLKRYFVEGLDNKSIKELDLFFDNESEKLELEESNKSLTEQELLWKKRFLLKLQQKFNKHNADSLQYEVVLAIDNYNHSLINLKQRLEEISTLTALVSSPIVNANVLASVKEQTRDNLKGDISSLYDDLFDLNIEYFTIDGLYNKDTTIAELKLIKLKALSDSIKNLIKINDLIALWQIIDESNFSFRTPPIETDGDEMEVIITIKPKSDSTGIIQSSLKGEVVKKTLDVTGKCGISFSTGYMVSGLTDDEYKAKANYNADTITNYSIIKEKGNGFTMGPTALLHYGWSNFGGHFGVGIPLATTVNPQFLFGASLLAGKKDRVAINLGFVAGRVDRISSSTNKDITYTSSPSINTTREWEVRLAISLTYNFKP